jgi:glycosyltransferase involved in cell wall biosynthesis
MKVLMLAPHPFYQARGTPIAADLVLRVLCEQHPQVESVDLLVFAEGSGVRYNGLTIHRTPALKALSNIRPGFSIKKLVCDGFLLIQALRLARQHRYDLVHAGEEAVFIAVLLKKLMGIPYVYDMDSSLAQQLIDKYPQLKFIQKLLRAAEGVAVRQANAVLAVCQALADDIQPYSPKKVAVIPDISLLNAPGTREANLAASPVEPLRQQLNISGPLLMYVGNLERYQGIDLLLASFAQALHRSPNAQLVAIGGTADDVAAYQAQANDLGVGHRVHFLGPRPIERLKDYLEQADIVVSPRIQGQNTPMKLYSYLDSGKALLATNLTTHTQVISEGEAAQGQPIALLAEPTVEAFAAGMSHLIENSELRATLGQAAQAYIAQAHTFEAFSQKLTALYDAVHREVAGKPTEPMQSLVGLR